MAAQLPKCKGEGHLKVDVYEDHELVIYTAAETLVKYVADLKCRAEGTSGPGIIVGTQRLFAQDRGLHVQLVMARQMPVMLRVAVAKFMQHDLAIYHTAGKVWIPWRAFDRDGASDLAIRIEKALIGH